MDCLLQKAWMTITMYHNVNFVWNDKVEEKGAAFLDNCLHQKYVSEKVKTI